MVGFFIAITREIMLLIGLVFPLLILLLERGRRERKHLEVLWLKDHILLARRGIAVRLVALQN